MPFHILVNENWPVQDLIIFIETLKKSLVSSNPILTVKDIYDLEMSKTMLENIDYFFPEDSEEHIIIFTNEEGDSLTRQKFLIDLENLLVVYRNSANETFTIRELLNYKDLEEFSNRLKDKISSIEKKISDNEIKLHTDE